MFIREATLDDTAALTEIRLAVTENVLADPSWITAELYVDLLTISGKGWVCEIGGQIVGFSVACIKDASIWALFVKPGYEGRHIGSMLLKQATDWLFENGASTIKLSTDPNTRADRFYELRGWARGAILPNGEVRYELGRRSSR